MIIQWLLIPAIIVAVLLALRSRNSLRGQARRKIVAVLTLVGGVVAVVQPDILQVIADFVGIARGADLILYGLALVIIYLVGSVSVRFREHEAKVVLLSRALAMSDAARRLHDQETGFAGTAAPVAVDPAAVDRDI
ncbi:DUF2304 domain-containing protein [Blastococcus capsensis]|uniref:DUF2304 domain-containing protein n=1 Tax=Blastococcus capsensis TaxID=1564163 RepID=UPI0025405FDF|nr:DUF2304 domain-containing protein [Blastococcus capsensis]MDK3256133.1 DUF2304 domain-containing protein [Blastococcus capsensis]